MNKIHLIDPIRGNLSNQFIEMRCGKSSGIMHGATNYTTDTDKVTCKGCLKRLNIPLESLRKYGQVKIFLQHALAMTSNGWYNISLVMYREDESFIVIAKVGKTLEMFTRFTTDNMTDAIAFLLNYYETELINTCKKTSKS